MTDIDPKALAHGDVFTRPHPFTWVEEGHADLAIECWRPGAREVKETGPYKFTAVCHDMGAVAFTVISTHKPPGYPERVFFKRQFFLPDGKPYAPGRLMNCVKRKFLKDVQAFPFPFVVEKLNDD